jgi:hypothetical protein
LAGGAGAAGALVAGLYLGARPAFASAGTCPVGGDDQLCHLPLFPTDGSAEVCDGVPGSAGSALEADGPPRAAEADAGEAPGADGAAASVEGAGGTTADSDAVGVKGAGGTKAVGVDEAGGTVADSDAVGVEGAGGTVADGDAVGIDGAGGVEGAGGAVAALGGTVGLAATGGAVAADDGEGWGALRAATAGGFHSDGVGSMGRFGSRLSASSIILGGHAGIAGSVGGSGGQMSACEGSSASA